MPLKETISPIIATLALMLTIPCTAWADEGTSMADASASLCHSDVSALESTNEEGDILDHPIDIEAPSENLPPEGETDNSPTNNSSDAGESVANNASTASQGVHCLPGVNTEDIFDAASVYADPSELSPVRDERSSHSLGWFEDADGSILYYERSADGSVVAHKGWLVDSDFRDYGLQRYWFDRGGHLAFSALLSESEAGWWAYATSYGYVARGRYIDPTTGYVYLADNDGRLESSGWVVSSSYGQGMQRYWVDADARACVPGFSDDGWEHYTTQDGYVLRGALSSQDGKRYANNDGLIMRSSWVVTDSFGDGLQRYWMDSNGLAASGRLIPASEGSGYDAYACPEGFVVRGAWADPSTGYVYLADNDGVLAPAGWVVSSSYGQGMQRYWVDADARACVPGFSDDGWEHYTTQDGYVLRGRALVNGEWVYANNDGLIIKNLCGFDMASWQDGIDLSLVPADFVIIKATQGDYYTFDKMVSYANWALSLGKQIGLYHFVDTSVSAQDQADYFISAIRPFIGEAVLFLDWENEGNKNNVSAGQYFAKAFLDRVNDTTGVKPLIYMSRSVLHAYSWSAVADSGYGLWIAQYLYKYYNETNGIDGYVTDPDRGTCTIGGTYYGSDDFGEWGSLPNLYQYTSTGKLSGWNGFLDLDIFYGTVSDWAALAKSSFIKDI